MKTRTFTLLVTILMMGAVIGATGQPDRGRRSGNHENNSRTEVKSAKTVNSPIDQKAKYDLNASEERKSRESTSANDNLRSRRETSNSDRPATVQNRNSNEDRRNNSISRNSDNSRGNAYDSRTATELKGGNAVKQDPVENRSKYSNDPGSRNPNGNIEKRKNSGNQGGFDEKRKEQEKHEGYTDNRDYRDYPNPDRRENYRNEWDHRNYNRQEWEHRNYNWNDHRWNYSNFYRKGHIPYYFRDNRNYWYYPEYGHILRGFRVDPFVFYSGRIPFYFEDGFFYRYYPGIGYVWIEDPYNIWFNELPHHAVRVRIGGHKYFRLGNAYFAAGHLGFRLVVLPDRYYNPRYNRGVAFEITARF